MSLKHKTKSLKVCIICLMEKQRYLDRINIVLVDTQDGANIGSVCRAMKTMGITDLSLVTSRSYDDNRVRTLALHASDIWENAKYFSSLEDALKNSIFAVGATRRRGKHRKLSAYSPEQLADHLLNLPDGKVSIVFGRESDGLRDDEVALCSSIVTIPTSDAFPSLNLSQAVQIITYTLFQRAQEYPSGKSAVTRDRIEKASTEACEHLSNIGYFKWDEEKKWLNQFFKDTLEKAGLQESEMQLFDKLFRKIEMIKIHKEDKNE